MRNGKIIIAIASAATLFCTGAAFAKGLNQEISATLNKTIKVTVNNQTAKFLDEDGKELNPITYKDRTYIPLRASSQLLGSEIDYDVSSNTVVMSNQAAPKIKDIIFSDENGNNIAPKANWIPLKNKTKITINLDRGSDSVELYYTPSGTGTNKFQKLIGIVSPQNNKAEFEWEVPEDIHGHFSVVAYSGDIGRKSEIINVTTQP